MKFGVREICNVVLKAKTTMTVGTKTFYKNEPVMYFDTLKTSSLEGTSNTVYAQGGRGNTNLVAWDGEKTVTFTMEDALISAEGLMVLAGAGLINAASAQKKDATGKIVGDIIYQHVTETIDAGAVTIKDGTLEVELKNKPAAGKNGEDSVYVMLVKDGEILDEPYIGTIGTDKKITVAEIENRTEEEGSKYTPVDLAGHIEDTKAKDFDSIIVDYYTERTSGAMQIDITPESFGGNFYLEADTLFRDTNGKDMPAEFIVPNCKIQSNFTFTMASSGDPSTFTFTLDAFPDYTRWDHSKKVLACIQVIEDTDAVDSSIRMNTNEVLNG